MKYHVTYDSVTNDSFEVCDENVSKHFIYAFNKRAILLEC